MRRYSSFKFSLENSYFVFAILVVIAIVVRFFSFFPSVIEHDTSTYLVIAKSILNGAVLYKDVIDIKPVGIFYILAAHIKIFGDSIFVFRLSVAILIAATSFIIYKIQRRLGYDSKSAFTSGVIYIPFLSVWTHYGVGINTEHFYLFFTALALWVLLTDKLSHKLWGSFILGIGFLIKIVVVFDFAAFMLYFFIQAILQKKSISNKIFQSILSGIVFLIPFALVNYAFYVSGNYEGFAHVHFQTFGNYPQEHHPLKLFVWILSFFARFFPISILFFVSLGKQSLLDKKDWNEKLFYVIWFCFILFSVFLPGKTLSHYTLQLMLPISMVAGIIFDHRHSKPKFLQILFRPKIGYSILFLFFLLNSALLFKDHFLKKDYPREVSNYLKTVMHNGDQLYTGNAQHIIYFLLDRPSPTPYIHRSLLFDEDHLLALNINQDEEFAYIFDQKPEFVLEKDSIKVDTVQQILKTYYAPLKYFEEFNLTVYQRIAP